MFKFSNEQRDVFPIYEGEKQHIIVSTVSLTTIKFINECEQPLKNAKYTCNTIDGKNLNDIRLASLLKDLK